MTAFSDAKQDPVDFDEVIDIAIVGYGFAGGMTAIAAAKAGRQAIIFEKMSIPGGLSICSGGGFRIATNQEKAYEYLKATNAQTINDSLLSHFAGEMVKLPSLLKELGEVNNASLSTLDRPANYPLPGYEAFQFMEYDSVPGFDQSKEFPRAKSLKSGANAFKVINDNVKNLGVEVRYSNAVQRLITDKNGVITGLLVKANNQIRRIGTRYGVVLACGGFEAGIEMQRQYWQLHPVLPAATLGNTGDGIKMAQALGADIGHMWHFHGSYGFRHTDPKYPFGIRSKKLPDWTRGVTSTDVRMSWILLNQDGKRFMNEYEPYGHDTGHRYMDQYEASKNRFPNLPAFMLFDEVGRKLYPVAKAFINDPDIDVYEWSSDNLKEVDLGILKKANSLEELSTLMNVPIDTLQNTIQEWNSLCSSNGIDEFGRPSQTRIPIQSAPYYFGAVWPVVSNTQGALIHNTKQEVLNTFDEVIPRLYVAGEIGSIWGFLYLSGGNLAECIISGQIAGNEVSQLEALQLS